ncbi:MAG TPA: hypothetical protein P5081_12295 [Phycisphaerae bacterium]|nr:hypothetical protein [Phycisphaerae bacterium]HRW53656.1 hypothetical protein [Phycisphaerae bacterium]
MNRIHQLAAIVFCFGLAQTAPALAQLSVTSTELAGNPLTQYPFFEYVRAFNENAPVSLAIDPTRFPGVNGSPVDIYVTEARNTAQWGADNMLVDARAAGPDTVTFNGANIQANTIEIAGPNELSGDAGIGFGVGYDVVIDVNQNGLLDTGDIIDGYSAASGFYVVNDLNQMGPLDVTTIEHSVGTVFDIPAGFTNERIYYPSNISGMTARPLVVVSHGNGHQYIWYDHIGEYLASYGYVVMAHQNNTVPGIETSATTIIGHTEAFLAQRGVINGGALSGKIDTTKITWIGHSRGAEAITRAYDRIFDGVYVPVNFSINNLRLLSSMLPTDFLGTGNSDPHNSHYHLWTAAADADVDGGPESDIGQTFHLHDRATNYRHSTIVQGAGHGDFHDGPTGSVAFGPCLIGRADTHRILLPYLRALIEYYNKGNVPAQDFFTRQWEAFHSIGAPTNNCIVVSHTFHNGADQSAFVIDDYQAQFQVNRASSGGLVTTNVSDPVEDRFDDGDLSFTWTEGDPENGMTYASATDTSRGVILDWDQADRFYEISIIPNRRNFNEYQFLSFRACQTTRHPLTIAELGDLTFSVALRDTNGALRRINIGAYGGGIEEPYARTGAGFGQGWGNEFETIRIRLTDFLTNGSGLDLTNIAAVRFEFGPSFGSTQGRIGLDQIEVTNDAPAFGGGFQAPADPRGACCLESTECLNALPRVDCVSLGGVWTGTDTTCDTVTCGESEVLSETEEEKPPFVVSLLTPDNREISIVSPAGTKIENAAIIPNPSPSDAPANVGFPVGFLTYQVTGIPSSGSVQVTIILPSNVAINSYWKYGPTPDNTTPHWYNFDFDGTTGTLIEGANLIKLHYVDGGRGDIDLMANGMITDPGGAGVILGVPTGPPTTNPTTNTNDNTDNTNDNTQDMNDMIPNTCGCGNGAESALMAPMLLIGCVAMRRRNRRRR